MALDRTSLRVSPKIERRPAVSKTVLRSAAAHGKSSATTLKERLGNRVTQLLISRSAASAKEGAAINRTVNVAQLPPIQFSRGSRLPVSKPHDPAELEAEETARKVVRMPEVPAAPPITQRGVDKSSIQRVEARPAAAAATPPPARVNIPGGSPLPAAVRNTMEPRFGASFSNVRIHTGESAAQQSAALNANAFTVGEHIFFGRDKFQPESRSGKQLIAHELTHTIQQGPAIQRDAISVHQHVTPQVQGDFLGIPSPREYFANKAANIPGFTLFTVVIGFNPITNARVERNAGNILRGTIQLIPGGKFITDALDAHGIFDTVSAWASQQFETIKNIANNLWQDIENFIKGFSITDLAHPGDLWDRAKAIVMKPVDRLIAFATALKDGIVKLIKDAILKPLAEFAKTTRGYPLLCTVMGKDPITGEPVLQDAESLLGAFMKFIGEEEIWENMQKAKAIPRAFAWFKGAVSALKGFISEIPGLFVQALRSLEVIDIVLIPRAFLKLAHVFGGFAVRFITWGATAVWNLLEIIFDVVSPGALAYIKKTGAALKSILKNPLPFVGNLVKAAKLGFSNFADHFLDHLKAGLIDWLTGSLPGIYIPKAFSLGEIAKFAFSVLGLTWANIRQKLVKATSETVVKALETGFDIVVTLVRDGPAAAWDKIKEQLANLKDMVIGGITDFVVDMVVKKAIPKFIAMFIPGAGFISAILSIYDTVMVFVNKIKQIVTVVTGFIDSIVAIASGAIGAAATRVENALAGVLSLAINFLAGFAGLGKVADKIMGVIEKIRAPIDKALDWLVNWIVTAAKSLGKMVAQAGVPKDPNERFKEGMEKAENAVNAFAGKRIGKILLSPLLAGIKVRYGFAVLDVFQSGKDWWIEGELNPKDKRKTRVQVAEDGAAGGAMPLMTVIFSVKPTIYNAKDSNIPPVSLWDHYRQQLQLQETKLRSMVIKTWLTNIEEFYGDKGKGIAAKGRSTEGDKIAKQIRDRLVVSKAKDFMQNDKSLNMEAAVAKAREFYSEQAVLHLLDQGGGGSGTEFLGDLLKAAEQEVQAQGEGYLGNARVDFSIGAAWPSRAKELKKNIEEKVDSSLFPTEKMNVKLEPKKE
jgi:hypothetical protein